MITKIYSCFDSAISAHLPPFFARSEGEAIRMITRAVNDPESGFFQHAKDYTLVCLGSFDDETGDLESAARSNVLNLASLKSQTPE
ncbi:nonstructural protein [Blackfly microvirus SF02]|uniref:Nonstructural protein n=1 Tax=Blackfly microvirus SF02 TaxID=2576452 RepID=A0A4P8PK30_9VIRU|nr:nonstructural protein [Blackfly microvirus SF02]